MVELKLCGNHSLSDLQAVASSNANYLGFIFTESKRSVDPNDLIIWLKEVSIPEDKRLVGVFVNPTPDEVEDVLKRIPLDILQLHGNEAMKDIVRIKSNVGLPIFKAIHHQPPESFQLMEELAEIVDGFIIDSKVRGAWGGTGVKFDWEAIPEYTKLATKYNKKCFIAGGITPENVSDCLLFEPPGIDLSSGIENDGKKNSKLIVKLEERILDYEQNLSR